MRVELYKPTEDIEVAVGDQSTTVTLDMSKEHLLELAEVAKREQGNIASLRVLMEKAAGTGDAKAMKGIDEKLSKATEDVVEAALGREQAGAVLAMCGGKLSHGTRALVLTPLMEAILEIVTGRLMDMRKSERRIERMAAQVAGGSDAQQPDRD